MLPTLKGVEVKKSQGRSKYTSPLNNEESDTHSCPPASIIPGELACVAAAYGTVQPPRLLG